MELIDINFLYKSGAVAKTIEDKDVFLLGRPNPQRGDGYLVMLINQEDLITDIVSKVPVPTPPPAQLPYKVFTAKLSQTGTNAPVAKVLQDTIGVDNFTYGGSGDYLLNFKAGVSIDDNKTFIIGNQCVSNLSGVYHGDVTYRNLNTQIEIFTTNSSGSSADGILTNNSSFAFYYLEIRVYP